MEAAARIRRLLDTNNPSVRWKIRVNVLGQSRESSEVSQLEEQVKQSTAVAALLQHVDEAGTLHGEGSVYDKWQGSHWVLLQLADIGYPKNDHKIRLVADRVVSHWLGKRYFAELVADRKSEAENSTFIHTLYSMRAPALYAGHTGDAEARDCSLHASEVFLKRRLYKRKSTGEVIKPDFVALHYPLYWHYDILGALKTFPEIGIVDDERFEDALDLLEQKQLPSGGWPAERRYYRKAPPERSLNADYVNWGGASSKKMNEWVTADALSVLRRFGASEDCARLRCSGKSRACADEVGGMDVRPVLEHLRK